MMRPDSSRRWYARRQKLRNGLWRWFHERRQVAERRSGFDQRQRMEGVKHG